MCLGMALTKSIFVNIAIGLFCYSIFSTAKASFPYYGTKIGSLTRLHHAVSGDVYAVDSRTIFIKNFNYDGEAPAAYFYVGNTPKPSNKGAQRLRDERGGATALTRRYRNKDITLSLPDGKTLRDIKWFSVWCDEFAVNFGDVSISSDLDFPRPQKISTLKGVHGVSSDSIVIVDAQTLLIPNFSYDGEAPDAKFWVGRGQRPSPQGLRIPDENGKESPLRRYDRKTIVLTLPDDLTIFDIGHFGVWCEAFTVDFGHVRIPEGLNVPPSLKMLGISPQSRLNCEVLYDDLAFEVRWAVAGDSIVIQLIGKLDSNEYMSFGVSKNVDKSVMIGSDVVVAWVEKDTGKGFAIDYYLGDKSQCSGGLGVCPKVNIEKGTNSIRLLNAAWVNGYSIVTYQRSLQANNKFEVPIMSNISQAIVWGIGPLNERNEASYHTHYTRFSNHIDFGRQPIWNCPSPEGSKPDDDTDEEKVHSTQNSSFQDYPPSKSGTSNFTSRDKYYEPVEEFYEHSPEALQSSNRRHVTETRPSELVVQRPNTHPSLVPTPKPVSTNSAWDIPAIQCYEPEDGVFYAQMGPTGGKHGYSAITGHVGWGVSWYINGLLIPDIHVVRGKTYTFVVEGGTNVDIPAKYHPFYITDDPIGGYEHKLEEEKKAVRIFAGVHRSRSGQLSPTGVGRLCNWTPDVDGPPADDYQSFGAYQRTLTLKCDPGEPGVITWTPDHNTPDLVYYQCFTHRYLGWRIHVHESCDDTRFTGSASERHEVRVPYQEQDDIDDITAEASIRHETKVSPNDNFLLKHQKDLIKNHNMNGTPPKLTFEITKSSEITKLISDGIRAAEALEESLLKSTNDPNSNGTGNMKNYKLNHINTKDPTKNILTPIYQYQQQSNTSHNKTKITNGAAVSSIKGQLLLETYLTTSVPQILHGESQINAFYNDPQAFLHINSQKTLSSTSSAQQNHLHNHLQQTKFHQHLNNLTNFPEKSQNPIGLSEYLRPPLDAALFHAVKLPGRRPILGPVNKLSYNKPVLPQQLKRLPHLPMQPIPQPSVIINHYRKPFPNMLRPFLMEKTFPMQPIAASVLMLGQQTVLGSKRKIENAPLKPKPSSIIPVPYSDAVPMESIQSKVFLNKKNGSQENPLNSVLIPYQLLELTKPVSTSTISPININSLKQHLHQFDLKNKEDETSLSEIIVTKSAINKGFKPDSVVVESGFRPIIRFDSNSNSPAIDQIAHRREDPGSEIDEVMETDTLFLTAQKEAQTQNFEPMFIPSPPDSTNVTINVQNDRTSSSTPKHNDNASKMLQEVPTVAQLRNSTIDFLTELNDESTSNVEDIITEIPTKMYGQLIENSINQKQKKIDGMKTTFEINSKEILSTMKEIDDVDDREAQAEERIDTYYLPPDNHEIAHAGLPSGAVVTFDGKSIVDSNLGLPPKLDTLDEKSSRRQAHSISQIEQLMRSTPQVTLFQGDIPQPVAEFISKERTRNQVTGTNDGGIVVVMGAGRVDQYLPSASVSPPRLHSTKLQILQRSIYKQ